MLRLISHVLLSTLLVLLSGTLHERGAQCCAGAAPTARMLCWGQWAFCDEGWEAVDVSIPGGLLRDAPCRVQSLIEEALVGMAFLL